MTRVHALAAVCAFNVLLVAAPAYADNHIGLRRDVRYFRNFEDTEANLVGLQAGSFSFYRASIGVLFRF